MGGSRASLLQQAHSGSNDRLMLVDRSRIRTRSRVRTRIARLGTLLGLISLVCATANAQRLEGGPSPLGDENYRHTLWTIKDGLYGTVQAGAQAPDGFSSSPHPKGSSVSIASSSGQFVNKRAHRYRVLLPRSCHSLQGTSGSDMPSAGQSFFTKEN